MLKNADQEKRRRLLSAPVGDVATDGSALGA